VGDGPLFDEVRARVAGKHIWVHGQLDRLRVRGIMHRARGLVFPSRWYEFFPLVYAEALASGLPVLAFRPSSVSEMVADEGTGLAVSWEDDLCSAIREAEASFPDLRNYARRVFEEKYSEGAFVAHLESVYQTAQRAYYNG
jgi:glycosyltransferase involved in cell wall biosynthesis